MVAGRCANPAHVVPIDRQSGNVQRAAPYAFVRLPLASDAQGERRSLNFVGIESANAVAIGDRGQVDKVNQSADAIEVVSFQRAAYQGFARRTVAAGVFTASFVSLPSRLDGRHLLDALGSVPLTIILDETVDFRPQSLVLFRILYGCKDSGTHHSGAPLSDVVANDNLHHPLASNS